MAEAVAVPVSGFNVPAMPAGGHERQPPAPAAPNPPRPNEQAPGFVTPPSGLSEADVQRLIAAAQLKPNPVAPVLPTNAPVEPAGWEFEADLGGSSDKVLKSYTDMLVNVGKGVDLDRALGNALSRGDATLIDRAYLTEKGGANGAGLISIAEAIVERVQAQSEAATQAAYTAAGGEAQWKAAAAVFDKQAPAHLKTVVAGLLDSGDRNGIAAGAKTIVDFVAQSGLVPNPAQLIHAGAAGVNSAQALSKAEFQTLHSQLDLNSRTYNQDRQDLFARRAIGKQIGK